MNLLFNRLKPLLICLFLTVQMVRGGEVNVFAAASLTDSLQAIAKEYQAQSGDTVIFNFAGSNVLARQISQGAPADLFFSADQAQMDLLAKAGLIVESSRHDLLSNRLVIVVPQESPLISLLPQDLAQASIRRIALADPQTVPAGVYAKEWLEKIGLWNRISSKVIPTENVRAALAAVESGNVDAGIVYKTDAAISKKAKVVHEVSSTEGPPISYPAALIQGSPHGEEAGKFLAYLASPAAARIFSQYGFSTQVP